MDVAGLLDSHKSWLELRINKKKKSKIYFHELWSDSLLFPLFSVQVINIKSDYSDKSITIVEKEVGIVASYKFNCRIFEIEKLQFTISKVSEGENMKCNILTGINYDNKELKSSFSDTLVTSHYALLNNLTI